MPRVVRLDPSLSMPEVLVPLRPDAQGLAWTILDLGEVVTWEELQIDLSELEQRIFSSNTGMHLSFTELREFGRRTRQVVDGLFVACADTARLPERQAPDATVLANAEMVVAAFDSTWWLISAPEHVLQRVASCFPELTEHDPSAPLRAWGPTPE